MKLKTYLYKQGYGFSVKFAQKLEIHPVYLSTLASGRCRPSPDLAQKIVEATNGEVTLEELLFPKPERAKRHDKPATHYSTSVTHLPHKGQPRNG